MLSFLICGIIFLLYSISKFIKTKILYPSVVFCLMWGIACTYIAAILSGYGQHLYLKEYYVFHYMDKYMIYVTIASILGFIIAQAKSKTEGIKLRMSNSFIYGLLKKYKWIMWLNFFGGILRIIVMVRLIGFESMMEYRLAANAFMMQSTMSFEGIVFKITAYIQLLSNFYVCLFGLYTGLHKLRIKETIMMFILFSPPQMATGGRLFVLYFIIYFFGSFLIGRGISIRRQYRKILDGKEKKIIIYTLIAILSFIPIIAILRGNGSSTETPLEKFAYITEGVLMNEMFMEYFPEGSFDLNYGKYTFLGNPSSLIYGFFEYKLNTRLSSGIHAFFFPFYWDFGYWGSIVMIFIFAYACEAIAIQCLNKLTLLRFFSYMIIVNMCYESVISQSITASIPSWELMLIFLIFYKPIFGKILRR